MIKLFNKSSKFTTVVLIVCCGLTAAVQGREEQTFPSWTRLAKAGFDLEQLDGIKARNSRPLTAMDGRPMSSLLTVVDDWEKNQFDSIPPLGLLDLLADTSNSVCRRVTMIGSVRQCLRIKANTDLTDAADTRDSFQLTIFPDLDGQQINVKTPGGESVPYGRFSVTVRASELPAGETEQSLLDKRVMVDGFHYRFWRYDSVFAEQEGLDGQVGALVIAGPMATLQPPSTMLLSEGVVWVICLLVAGIVAMAGLYGRALSNADRSYDALPDMLPDDWKVD